VTARGSLRPGGRTCRRPSAPVVALLLLVGCGSSDRIEEANAGQDSVDVTAEPSGGSPDPCLLVDRAHLERVLGASPGPPSSTSAMSADGVGLVLNCTLPLDGAPTATGPGQIGYVQRLNLGRPAFEANRAATPDAIVVGEDRYWVPSKSQLHAMDGDDLVALVVRGGQMDLPAAQSLIDDALARRG
jgi:hypothetical protein